MNRVIIKTLLLALPLAIAVPAFAAPPVVAAPEEGEPTEAEALEDDILLVIDLPLAADDARDAGVDEAEITEALDAAQKAEVSAGDMAEVLAEEASETRAKGKRVAFGQWVKLQIAAGIHGPELAAMIKERKSELAAMTDEEKAELDAKITALGEKRRERKQKLDELRKKLRDEGKEPTFAGKERHDALMKASGERHSKARADWAKHKDKHGNKADKADKVDEVGDKDGKIEEKIEEKIEDKKEAREDVRDAREEVRDAKEDVRDAKEEARDAKKDKRDDKADAKKHDGHNMGAK